MLINVESDAWADGQVGSKIWLCEVLENIKQTWQSNPVVWLLGGWYAQTAFLMFARDRLRVSHARSFDVDPSCEAVANFVCNRWQCLGRFMAYTSDANLIEFEAGPHGPAPHIVVNTAVEHFHSHEWFDKLPQGTTVVVQATDMDHDDHHHRVTSVVELEKLFPMSYVSWRGTKRFDYPDKSFTRFMLVGVR